jgi:pimeloyl-ACP methyl ester carboxylesterase
MSFVTVHDRRMHVREAGETRGGAPIVLVHGAGTSSTAWLGLIGRLARHNRVVAPDLPGHGRSEGRVETIDDWRDAIGMCAASLCLPPSILIGHSLGGAAAMLAALEWPEKVAGLILIASAPRFAVSPQLLETLDKRFADWPGVFSELYYSPETPAEVRRRGAELYCSASREQTIADFRAAAAVDLRGRLAEIRCPTLVLAGADDLVTPRKWSELLASSIPGAKLVVLPRTGHVPMDENPDALAVCAGFSPRTV